MKTNLVIICLLGSILTPVAFSQDLDFEGYKKSAIDHKPFTLGAEDVASQVDHVIERSGPDKEALRADAAAAMDRFKNEGFDAVESTTDKALRPIVTNANEYLNEFNKAEKRLNEMGHSLREAEGQVAQVVHETQKFDREALARQVKEGAEVYGDEAEAVYSELKEAIGREYENAKSRMNADKAEGSKEAVYLQANAGKCGAVNPNAGTVTAADAACFADGLSATPDSPLARTEPDTCKADSPLGKAFLANDSWNDGGGDATFGWNAEAKYKLSTDSTGITLLGDASGHVSSFGKKKEIVSIHADFHAPTSGEATSVREIKLFGKKTANSKSESYSIPLMNSKNDRGEELYLEHIEENIMSYNFVVGFVPVTVMVDSRVDFGPTYSINVAPVRLVGKFEVVEKLTLIASAGVGADLKLFMILAGVKGYVDLLNAAVGVHPSAELVLDDKNHPQIAARISALAKLTTLSGHLDLGVWAKTTFSVPQPKSKFPYFEMKPLTYDWHQTIAQYPGYDFPQVVLFDKKIGYDICSGRKQIDTIVANQPRPADQRESLAEAELRRVTSLEETFKAQMDESLHDGKDEKAQAILRSLTHEIDALTVELSASSLAILQKVAK